MFKVPPPKNLDEARTYAESALLAGIIAMQINPKVSADEVKEFARRAGDFELCEDVLAYGALLSLISRTDSGVALAFVQALLRLGREFGEASKKWAMEHPEEVRGTSSEQTPASVDVVHLVRFSINLPPWQRQ